MESIYFGQSVNMKRSDGRHHPPLYRQSTMPASWYLLNATRFMASKTCMILMISPGLILCEHTPDTLHYFDRVKELLLKDAPKEQREDNVEQIMEDDGNNDDINGDLVCSVV